MTSSLVRIEDLAGEDADAMLVLMHRFYTDVHADRFEEDLRSKSHALLLREGDDIIGFTTLAVFTHLMAGGSSRRVLYSGDTILDSAWWGSARLAAAWGRAIVELDLLHDDPPCLWLLLAGGVRTYRLLPLAWRNAFPVPHKTDAELESIGREIATVRFGDRYDHSTGVVRFHDTYRLRDEYRVPDERIERDELASYFASRNPGHIRGDELVCVAEMTAANLTRAAQRLIAGATR